MNLTGFHGSLQFDNGHFSGSVIWTGFSNWKLAMHTISHCHKELVLKDSYTSKLSTSQSFHFFNIVTQGLHRQTKSCELGWQFNCQ